MWMKLLTGLMFALLMTSCAEIDYHAASGEHLPKPGYVLLARSEYTKTQLHGDFDTATMIKLGKFSITKSTGADGVLNCVWKLVANTGDGMFYISCRPFKLIDGREIVDEPGFKRPPTKDDKENGADPGFSIHPPAHMSELDLHEPNWTN
jgi:hypothetical protein